MKKKGFEYYMNAIHYCIYREEVWSNAVCLKTVMKCMRVISELLNLKEWYYRRDESIRKDTKGLNYMFGKESGLSIGMAHHWFGLFYSAYPAFFSWVLVGIADRTFGELNKILFLLFFGIPIVICYIPAYKAVFSDDKYLKYFKQFEKEDKQWHKKWKRITIVFCVGALLTLVIGFFCMAIITSL